MSEARILVVDDEPDVCELVADWLAQEGEWTVDYTTEPLRALEQVGRSGYDLMVTDLCMPQMHGLDLARQARGICPDLTVIGITGYASIDSSVEALRQGFVDYLQKPFRVEDLRAAVYRALCRRKEIDLSEDSADQVTHDNALLAATNDDMAKRLELVSRELTVMQQRLAGQVADFEVRCNAADMLDGQRDIHQLLGMALVMLRDQLPAEQYAVALLQRKPARVTVAASIEDEEVVLTVAEQELSQGVMRAVLKRGQPALIEDLSDSAVMGDAEKWIERQGSLLVLPLIGNTRTQAVALIRREETGMAFSTIEVRRALRLGGEIGHAIEVAKTIDHQRAEALTCLKMMADGIQQDDVPLQGGHNRRVTHGVRSIARRLGLEESRIEVLETAARLHDIGKLLLPPELLARSDSLDEQAIEQWQSHAERGWMILKPLEFLDEAVDLIRYHHNPEQWDDDPPVEQQILAAVECYDELTHDGVHGPALPHEDAMAAVRALFDGAVSPPVMRALEQRNAVSH
ncbi:MAG: response regulator [Anaerolineaceae bacterium]|nr:response regulator [Anaerolineaceae bacterium]